MMIKDKPLEEIFTAVKKRAARRKKYPISTYRLQFNGRFTFHDACDLVNYLFELGITDIYSSPLLKARTGSLHGYDVTDHNSLNPEIGSLDDLRHLTELLKKHDMGNILDIVPNHMSIFENPWWEDVLENGPGSPYSRYFDIDWQPIKTELRNKVLLPVLDEQYGQALQEGKIKLIFDAGSFFALAGETKFPIDPGTCSQLLEVVLAGMEEKHPHHAEIKSIIGECRALPARTEKDDARLAERSSLAGKIRQHLGEIYAASPVVRSVVDAALKEFNGRPGNARSFDRLHELLERQAYRLSFWRVALDEINYRRFMGINDLAAIRVEYPPVFDTSHRLIFQLLEEGLITGLRIDHIDGLFAPGEYLRRLQKDYFSRLCREEMQQSKEITAAESESMVAALAQKFASGMESAQDHLSSRPLFVTVEKILGEKEDLRESWPVEGTSGYDFAALLNGIFINRRNRRALLGIYHWFTKTELDFETFIYECKKTILQTRMQGEINVLARELDRLSEKSRLYRDFTLNSLQEALIEVIACFPVYRTYIDAFLGRIDEKDRAAINTAVGLAKKRNPAFSFALFDYLQDSLLLKYPPDMDDEGRRQQHLFVMRFQQSTGPVMVKGVEDTALYRYNSLVSLNEVGDSPRTFGNTVAEFHRQNIFRQKHHPRALLTTSTHDSKRSEDVRARINVLSEMPADWKTALARWSKANKRKKKNLGGEMAPDRNDEYLIYQTLIGTFPFNGPPADVQDDSYIFRIRQYIQKAIKEAKVHTSWINPNSDYEAAVDRFISDILSSPESSAFREDFSSFARQIALCGAYSSLSQTLLKIFSPGVADLYQGNELMEFRLVDPDNRAPVDYSLRINTLHRIKTQVASGGLSHLISGLTADPLSGETKLYVTWKALTYKRDSPYVFQAGTYTPLEAAGSRRSNICAFVWRAKGKKLVVVVPRLLWKLTRAGRILPFGEPAWENSGLIIPRSRSADRFHNIFTGEEVKIDIEEGIARLPLSAVFSSFPVAVLEQI